MTTSQPTPSNARNSALQVTTPSDREIRMTRVFAAPRQLVFDCWTKPDLTNTVLYASKEGRDGALASGMEHGVAASYDRLETMLPALVAA